MIYKGEHRVVTQSYIGDSTYKRPTVKREYNGAGEVLSEEMLSGASLINKNMYKYDGAGNVLEKLGGNTYMQSRNSYTEKMKYDAMGNVTEAYREDGKSKKYTYDGLGRMLSETDYEYNETEYKYDSFGNLVKTTRDFNENDRQTSYRYFDTAGNVTVENVQNNSVGQTESYAKTSYMYDKRNRVTTVIDRGTGGKDTPIYTQYEYDNVGNVTRVVTGHTKLIAAGEEVPEGATENRYEYDRFGNVTKAIDGMGNEITTEYNLMGLAKKVTDRNGTVTQSTYNGYGSPLEVKTGGEETKKYTYSVNNLVKKTEYGEESTTYTYDKFGNVASEKTGDIEKKYTYDTNGNVTGTDVYRGTVREIHEIRQYDVLNRLTLVNNMDAITANYEYTANGNVKKETKPNLTTTYTYSLAGLLTRKQTVSKSDGIIKNNNYVYDLRGNIVKKTSNDEGTTNYVYDGHNRLISEETGGKSKKYTYDGRGNRTRLETYDTVINYTYDKNNRLVNEEVDEDGDRYWYRNYTYSYDKNGNRLTKKLNGSKTLETNTYNGYNQLISRTENGKTNTYTYDIGGLRKSKTVNGVTTKQVWSMGELAMEINGGTDTVKAKYYHGITPIGMRTSGGQLYYTTSYNGTVEKVTNLGGGVVADYTYDAFGNQTDSTADEIYNPFRYCGEYYDEESGLIYLRNRYYDPSIGAFINEDPIRDGLNWYSYCSGNPVMFVDPLGLEKEMLKYAVDMLNTTTNYNFSLSWDDTTKTAILLAGGMSTGISYSSNDYNLVGGRIIIDSYGLENDLRNAGFNIRDGASLYCNKEKLTCDISFDREEDAAIQLAYFLNDDSKRDCIEYGMNINQNADGKYLIGRTKFQSPNDNHHKIEIIPDINTTAQMHIHWDPNGYETFSGQDMGAYNGRAATGEKILTYYMVDKNNLLRQAVYEPYIAGETPTGEPDIQYYTVYTLGEIK